MVYRNVSAIDFALEELPVLPPPRQVLLTTPAYFEVRYVINPHMAANVGTVDHAAALRQWEGLRDAYASLGIAVHTLKGEVGLPDMVFCANQTLPVYAEPPEERKIILSRMHAPERRAEVPHYAPFFRRHQYVPHTLPDHIRELEGMGDALWHLGRALLWGGYGFRSDLAAYEYLSDLLSVPVIAFRLEDPDFYHLDTCLCLLNEETALIYPGAFDAEGLALLEHFFRHLIIAPEVEARHFFACNAHCPDGRHVIIQRGAAETNRILADAGFVPVEIDTSEFLKSGGSVFCMKQMFW